MELYKFARFCLSVLLFSLSFGLVSAQETGLFVYDGGYFVKSGDSWEEYRPDRNEGVWATYEQYNEEADFYNLRNSKGYVSVPKSTVNAFYYAAPGEKWKPIYTTKAIYEYMTDPARAIYCYQGGYFVRDGLTWREYRPGDKRDLWAEYVQNSTDDNFFYISNEGCKVAVPKSDSERSVYLSKNGGWEPIYSLVGIYDCGKGFDYSMGFEWCQVYDDDASAYGDSVSLASRVSFGLDGVGEVRTSESRHPFSFKSLDLYESSAQRDNVDSLIAFLFGFYSSDNGFVLYAQKDGVEEILTYIDSSDGAFCIVNLPGLPRMRLSGCLDTDVGDHIHDLIEENLSTETGTESE